MVDERASNKAALVTGANSGIGLACARELARLGYVVGVLGRRDELVRTSCATIASEGGRAIGLSADVADAARLESVVEDFVRQTGGIDAVVASAGVHADRTSQSIGVSEWDEMIAVNLNGMFYTAKFTVPHLIRRKGAFVAIGSSASVVGMSHIVSYAASKHGVAGLVKALALDHGPSGLRANAICPGIVLTPMAERGLDGVDMAVVNAGIPVGRLGDPAEIAKFAAYLCSEHATFINGAILCADGGVTAGKFAKRR
jgi:meso-butanediol dehydrogenase / (S,S)-butanediol dehydrogenase / diacetyl reductase